MIAVLLLTGQAIAINRLAGLPYPLWAPRPAAEGGGAPPGGRPGGARPDPSFWSRQWQPAAAGSVLFFLVLALVLILVL